MLAAEERGAPASTVALWRSLILTAEQEEDPAGAIDVWNVADMWQAEEGPRPGSVAALPESGPLAGGGALVEAGAKKTGEVIGSAIETTTKRIVEPIGAGVWDGIPTWVKVAGGLVLVVYVLSLLSDLRKLTAQ